MTVGLRICIDVADLDRGIAFYTAVLGLTVGRRLGESVVELLGAAAPIDLLAQPAGTVAVISTTLERDYARHWTPVHLDVVVASVDDAVRRAEAAGALLDRPVQDRPWGRMANLSDPFGHGLCLLEFRGRGYDEVAGQRRGSRSWQQPGTPPASLSDLTQGSITQPTR